jgi:hypothetical protein
MISCQVYLFRLKPDFQYLLIRWLKPTAMNFSVCRFSPLYREANEQAVEEWPGKSTKLVYYPQHNDTGLKANGNVYKFHCRPIYGADNK